MRMKLRESTVIMDATLFVGGGGGGGGCFQSVCIGQLYNTDF